MNKERAITYSLLAHIRNTGDLANGPIDIFVPLIKRAISKMNAQGIYQGKSILEIKEVTDELYKIDFPIPVLNKILGEICKEVNDDEVTRFVLHKDLSFSINQYTFDEFEEVIMEQEKGINEIEELFQKFCETSELEVKNSDSIFQFIEKNKFNLSKYISNNQEVNGNDYNAEAQFIDFFKRIPTIYEKIKNIYLGSIISGYIEYDADEAKKEIKLLLDTNFVVGLLDLNTPESTHTCRTLINIAQKQGYKTLVLKDTLEETNNLLENKANYFDKSFLQKKVNSEDVYNACERRGLSKSDLERIADNLETSVSDFGVHLIPYTKKLKNEAKFTDDYKFLQTIRNTKMAALHDATALLYVKKERENKRIKNFDNVSAWFVNNSSTIEGDSFFLRGGYQPETIKADDLLNILWLSNPQINESIKTDDLAEIGLTSTIAITLKKGLPKSKILRELDDNIHKYAKETISDADVLRVATRITNKQLKDIEKLNQLAENDKVKFVKRLEEEAKKQKRLEEVRLKSFEKAFADFSAKAEEIDKIKKEFIAKKDNADSKVIDLEKKLLKEKNTTREIKRETWINKEIYKWRRKSWILFVIALLIFIALFLYLLNASSWDLNQAILRFKTWQNDFIIGNILSIGSFIFMAIVLYLIKDKYWNHSNIKSYRESLKIPKDLREIKE